MEQIAACVACVDGLELAVVFGSTARGTASARSDVDVAVLLRDPSPASLRALDVALGRALGRAVDVVDLAWAPPQLRFEVSRDGAPVFEARPWAWADFRREAMLDWWDWAETARRMDAALVARLLEASADGAA